MRSIPAHSNSDNRLGKGQKNRMKNIGLTVAALTLTVLLPIPNAQQQTPASHEPLSGIVSGGALLPTKHPQLPADPSKLWLAPDRAVIRSHKPSPAVRDVVTAIGLQSRGEYSKALPLLTAVNVADSATLRDYATYYAGLSELRLDHPSEARKTF